MRVSPGFWPDLSPRFDYVRDGTPPLAVSSSAWPGRRKDLSQWRAVSGLMAFIGKLRDKQGLSERLDPFFPARSFLSAPRRRKFTVIVVGIIGEETLTREFSIERGREKGKFHSAGRSECSWMRRDKGGRIKNCSF